MSYAFYKVLHLSALALLCFGLGGLSVLAAQGAAPEAQKPFRPVLLAAHGLGMLLLLVAGFGALAKLGLMKAPPGWVWGKLALWGLLGATPALLKRCPPGLAKASPFVLTFFVGLAAFLAQTKPGG